LFHPRFDVVPEIRVRGRSSARAGGTSPGGERLRVVVPGKNDAASSSPTISQPSNTAADQSKTGSQEFSDVRVAESFDTPYHP